MSKAKIIKTRPLQSQLSIPDMSPLLQRIYSARNITSVEELESGLDKLASYKLLKNIESATELLMDAVYSEAKILIVGDFDADGATSCAVAVKALRALGHHNVSYLVPNRFDYGYGLTPEIVDVAAKMGPDLIVTVDNGIASMQGVQRAHEYDIAVLVTDHHLPGKVLPEAEAIVNPNQLGCNFPSKNLAGVGVIFYVMISLRQALRDSGWFQEQGLKEPNLGVLLDLVALGTVADVVPLDHNNRILVSQGIARIRAGHVCPGIKALLKVSNKKIESLVSADMGFSIGPRLNAAGRLDDMSRGIECLLAEDDQSALTMATELHELNKERRDIEQDMKEQAEQVLATIITGTSQSDIPYGISLYDANWHQGVIGILASRIKEAWHRPVIIFANADTAENTIKGSARSIKGLHIRDALDLIATRNPELIITFGGHAMAAGLTLKQENFEIFQEQFNSVVEELVSREDLEQVIYTDGELPLSDITLENAELIQTASPWGQAFPEPVFAGEFEVKDYRIVGEKHLKLRVQSVEEGVINSDKSFIDAIAFSQAGNKVVIDNAKVCMVYRLSVNDYNGSKSVQLMVEHIE
ncbi:Single-stranded-DNA-specific exonuclease RecJ [hydrothermal vent metagenome]|uniref:Single-stranded-DNA-specific exonuclease RecJ n=1 Tax=hydrothermal vent metagenome TaxID=652676 RepID=A0A3B0ZIP4_9ZZZZ